MPSTLSSPQAQAVRKRDPQALVTHLRNISLRIQTLAGRSGLNEAETHHLLFLQKFFWQGLDMLSSQEKIPPHRAVELVIAKAREEQGELLLIYQVVGPRTTRRLRCRPQPVSGTAE
jgi:hypothetical protein